MSQFDALQAPLTRPAAAPLSSVVGLALAAASCGSPPIPETASEPSKAPPASQPVTISVVGTSDLHGHVEALPWLAGYVGNIDRAGGHVVPVDAGDMFQGTLESNVEEGAPIVAAYGKLGYRAVAIGNHDFDYGPVGPNVVATGAGDDPQGALRARAAEASYPFLAANIVDAHGSPLSWENVAPTTLITVAGVRIGIVGVTTEETPQTTLASGFAGLAVLPVADTIEARARELRKRGASLVIAAAHEGASCSEFDDPDQLGSCVDHGVFAVARKLTPGLVDVIVAGHMHTGVAHRVNGIAVVEAFAKGSAFSRVDLTVSPDGKVEEVVIHPPESVCRSEEECAQTRYEGRPVVADPEIVAIARAAVERVQPVRERSLGVDIASPLERAYGSESALGNLFADLMRAARPGTDVAITNGGGLRAALSTGPLTYGALHLAMPFDNRFAHVTVTAAQLKRVLADNLLSSHGILLVSGVRAKARCVGSELRVDLFDERDRPMSDKKRLVVVTSDFLATGGDGIFAGLGLAEGAVTVEDDLPIRDVMATVLSQRGGSLSGDDPALYDSSRPRLDYRGSRPLRCTADQSQ